MGLNWKLIAFPAFVLILSIIFQSGTVKAGSQPVTYGTPPAGSIPGANTDCSNFAYPDQLTAMNSPACLNTIPSSGSVSCNPAGSNNLFCAIFPFCLSGPTVAVALYCISPYGFGGVPTTVLNAGNVAFFGAAGPTGSFNDKSTSQSINVGSLSASGFVGMVALAIAGAAIVGVNIFSSGESQEGLHILFLGTILLAIWGILSAAEGFLTGNANSFFYQLNLAYSGIGDVTYILLTMVYSLGIIGGISRGGTG